MHTYCKETNMRLLTGSWYWQKT